MIRLAFIFLALTFSFAGLATDPVEDVSSYATVYILRSSFINHPIRSSIEVNDKYLGSTYGGTYIKTKVPAGTHTFTGEMQNRSNITLEVEHKRTYFIKQRLLPSLLFPNNKLVLLEPSKGLELLGRCKASSEQSINMEYAQY